MGEKVSLANKLLEITYHDAESQYDNRNLMVYEAIALAQRCGYKAGIRFDPKEPEWPVAFIELPTGQISYHLPQHVKEWDNHSSEEKRLSILEYVAIVSQKGEGL
jgi:hypothetical protein